MFNYEGIPGEGKCLRRGKVFEERRSVWGEGKCLRRGEVFEERGSVQGAGKCLRSREESQWWPYTDLALGPTVTLH